MNKNKVIETAYEAIKSSLDWGEDDDHKYYIGYIQGIITMTDYILETMEGNNIEEKDDE